MATEFQTVFARLRDILHKQSGRFLIKPDTDKEFGFQAAAGPAAIKAWCGKKKSPMISIAWVRIGKGYVSYHLMGLYGNSRILSGISKKLKTRMQGKTCFNFKKVDEILFVELEQVTHESITAFQEAGYIEA